MIIDNNGKLMKNTSNNNDNNNSDNTSNTKVDQLLFILNQSFVLNCQNLKSKKNHKNSNLFDQLFEKTIFVCWERINNATWHKFCDGYKSNSLKKISKSLNMIENRLPHTIVLIQKHIQHLHSHFDCNVSLY